MGRSIRHYLEEDIKPLQALDWETVKALLWTGFNPQWAESRDHAEIFINNGGIGNSFTWFESFSCIIWCLMRSGQITVTDQPRPPTAKLPNVHVNLFICLQHYCKQLNESYSQRMEAWQKVCECLESNGFDEEANRNAICDAVYDLLLVYIRSAWNHGSNALVVRKARNDMLCSTVCEDIMRQKFGSFPDRGEIARQGFGALPSSDFSPQIWWVNFDADEDPAVRQVKTQRALNAFVTLALGEIHIEQIPRPSRSEMTYLLPRGMTARLQKSVAPGGMVSFHSSSWDWHSEQMGDKTSLNLLNDEGDIVLHISLRQGENAIVLNSRPANGAWGTEERLQLRHSFVDSNFTVSIRHHSDRYEILFSYLPATYYNKRIAGVISSVSYKSDQDYSPLSDPLTVSVIDSIDQLAQTNHLVNCKNPGGSHGSSDSLALTTQPTFKHGANLVEAPGRKKKDNLGFEYAEHCYIGDAITLTLADGSRVTAINHTFTLENNLRVTYGEINGLGGDFYGTDEPISDGANDVEKADRFVKAYDTLAARSARQPTEATKILGVLKEEVAAVNNALAHHQDPSVAYNSLPDVNWEFTKITAGRPRHMPSYGGLARINWDHFGEDARSAYNAGHSKALDVAISGNLEKAYAMNAFADHFLEDSFAAGHLRTPRRALHSAWNLTADICAKYMHDEDNAIGLSVTNPAGATWTAFGDKRCLDVENDENKRHCLEAIQASADEIYNAWRTQTKPSPSSFGAWAHAPTLESARGPQTLAPLVKDGKRRVDVKNRRSWTFTDSWTYEVLVWNCFWSGWWKYPITIDGPSGVLAGSDVAVTATDSMKCKVYYQDAQGGIRERINDAGWRITSQPIFSAKLYSPLAVVSFDSGRQVRVYCVSDEGYLQEWCYSSGQDDWFAGSLTESRFRVASNTKLAAVYWDESIRVYAQEPSSDHIREYCYDQTWTRGAQLPVAYSGSNLAAVCWKNHGIHIRVYYQAPELVMKEHCFDAGGDWYTGLFKTDKMPHNASLTAVGWYDSDPKLRVYCQDAKRNIVAYKWMGFWCLEGKVIEPLELGRRSAALQWNRGAEVRFYYQADDEKIHEQCQAGEEAPWYYGIFEAS